MNEIGGARELREIGYFRVTARELGDYEKYCHFRRENIRDGGVVIDVGSGWNQELSGGLTAENRGIKVISLDASLAIPDGGLAGVRYLTDVSGFVEGVSSRQARERLRKVKDNSIAAVMPRIPLKSEIADLVVDCYGPGTYLNDEQLVHYVGEVSRVLKEGGEGHIYPIDGYDDYVRTGKRDRIEKSANRRVRLLKRVAFGVSIQKYSQTDNFGIVRFGLIVKKKKII